MSKKLCVYIFMNKNGGMRYDTYKIAYDHEYAHIYNCSEKWNWH